MNKYKSVGIKSTGYYVPEKILTNFDLEKIVDTTDEWIVTRTGIRERRIAEDNMATSDLAYKATIKALEKSNISVKDIDCIIVATASPDMFFPSTACILQDKIGASNASAFDLFAGCSGFIYSMFVGSQMISTGIYKNILLVGAETLSRFMDWQDRNTCVIFGDGAGAVIISEVEAGKGILATDIGAEGSGGDMLKLPAGGSRLPSSEETIKDRLHYIKMEGREVFKSAIRYMTESIEKSLHTCNLKLSDIDILIPHQANKRIIQSVGKKLSVPEDKVYVNVDLYGNTSSASIILALSEAAEKGKIKENDIVAMTAFGAGYTWGSAILRW